MHFPTLKLRPFLLVFFISLLVVSPVLATVPEAVPRETGQAVTGVSASAAAIYLVNESFEDTTDPAGWVVQDYTGNGVWRFDNPGSRSNNTGGSGGFAIADSDQAGAVDMDTGLLTPVFDLSGYSSAKLRFSTEFKPYETSIASVYVDINDGQWYPLWEKSGAAFAGTVTLDLTPYVGESQVRIAFQYFEANYDYWWQLDDVQVFVPAALAPPADLDATADQYDIALTWTDTTAPEDAFVIERSTDGTNWSQVARVAASSSAYTDRNLGCETTYAYRVRAMAGSDVSDPSSTASATTGICAAASSVSESFEGGSLPVGWTLATGSGTSTDWQFGDPGGRGNETPGGGGFAILDSDHAGQVPVDAELRTPVLNFAGEKAVRLAFNTSFKAYQSSIADVDVSRDGGATWTNVWRKQGASVQDGVSLDISAQAANQSNVVVRFRYYNVTWGWYWQVDDVVIEPVSAPAAPSGLSGSLDAENNVHLSWQGDATAHFKIVRSTDTKTWFRIAMLTNGATTYTDKDVASNTTYYYSVQASNGAGTSSYSPGIGVTTGDRSVRTIDVTISYAGIPSTQQRGYMENVIGYFADAVYEMTNGANKIGRVTVYTGGAKANEANVRWAEGTCRAWANMNGYFTNGVVSTCDKGDLSDPYRQQLNGYTLGHEWGHYFYGVYDEYVEEGQPCDPNDPSSPCQDDVGVEYSVMHYQGYAAGPNGDFNWLNFSTPLNNTAATNAQYRAFGASAWETLVRPPSQDPRPGNLQYTTARTYHPELADAAPAASQWPSLELNQSDGQTAARSALTVVWTGNGTSMAAQSVAGIQLANGVARQIVVDSSAGMAATGKLADAQTVVATLVGQAAVGDTLGVLQFAGTVTPTQVLTDVTEANRNAVQAAVVAMPAGGADAAIGDALRAALDGFVAADVPAEADRAIYLITAGNPTTGLHPLDVISDCQAAYVPVYVFGYDVDLGDADALRELAAATGGAYYAVGNAYDLLNSLVDANQATSFAAEIGIRSGWDTVSAGTSVAIPIKVDATLGALAFETVFFSAPTSVTLTLYEPEDDYYDIDPETDCEVWGEGRDVETVCAFGIDGEPMAGTWTLEVEADTDVDFLYWVSGEAKEGGLTYTAQVELMSDDVIAYPQPIVIGAAVGKELPITGVVVTATIEAPDGTYDTFPLYDNGEAPDDVAGDGLYSGIVDYWTDGKYLITVAFDNTAETGTFTGEGVSWDHDPTNPIPEPYPVEEGFERFAEVVVTVTGWQEDDHVDWPDDPAWPATVLQLDNTPVPGRIDFADDADVFQIIVPADYDGTLGLRVDSLGLDMDPYLYLYAADGSWAFERYLEYVPTGNDALFVPLDAEPGATFYVEVWHYDEEAMEGVYNISAGPWLSGDAVTGEKPLHMVYLPLTIRGR